MYFLEEVWVIAETVGKVALVDVGSACETCSPGTDPAVFCWRDRSSGDVVRGLWGFWGPLPLFLSPCKVVAGRCGPQRGDQLRRLFHPGPALNKAAWPRGRCLCLGLE